MQTSHQCKKKRSGVNTIPLHPTPTPLLLSSQLPAAVLSGCKGSLPRLPVETSPGLGAFLALCVNTCAQKGRVVSEWFGYTGPLVSQWALECGSAEYAPLPPFTPIYPPPPFFNSHWHTLQLTSRLMFSQSMGCLWLPDYSINQRWTLELVFRTCRWVSASIRAGRRHNRWLFLLFLHLKWSQWNTLLSQAVKELITDSHKSTQLQYNRARPFIIPTLTSNTFHCPIML